MKKEIYIAFAIIMVLGLVSSVLAFWPFTGKAVTTGNAVATIKDCKELMDKDADTKGGVKTVQGIAYSSSADNHYWDKCKGDPITYLIADSTSSSGYVSKVGYKQLGEAYCNAKKNVLSKTYNAGTGEVCIASSVASSDGFTRNVGYIYTVPNLCKVSPDKTFVFDQFGKKFKFSCDGLKYKYYVCNDCKVSDLKTTDCTVSCTPSYGCNLCDTTDSKNEMTKAGVVSIAKSDGTSDTYKDKLDLPTGKISQVACNKDGTFKYLALKSCDTGSTAIIDATTGAAYCSKTATQDDLTNIKTALGVLQNDINGYVDSSAKSVKGLKDRTADLEKFQTDINSRVDAIDNPSSGTIKGLQDQINDLKTQINVLAEDICILKGGKIVDGDCQLPE